MKALNILYLNHYAGGPAYGMEFRPHSLAREWVRAGHAVTVVGASHSHVRSRQPSVPGRFAREAVDGVQYLWLRTPAYAGNGVARVLNIAAFLWRLYRWRAWLQARPDVVVASSTYPADVGPARAVARAHGAKLVWELHDLWPLSPIEIGGLSPRHPFVVWMQLAENAACRHADVVVSMLPKVADHLAAHGLDLRKLHIVPNGVAPEDWAGTPPPLDAAIAERVAETRAAGRTLVVYAGSHGEPNALDLLLDAAARLRAERFSFVLVGDGHERQRLVSRVAAEGLSDVAMFAPIPKAQIPALLAQADIAWLGWKRQPLYRFGIAPNKLMDYMMAGVPVVHAVEAGNDPVADAGCGLTVAPEDPAATAEGLRRLAAMPAEARRAMGARGRDFVLAHHTWPVLARRFLEALG